MPLSDKKRKEKSTFFSCVVQPIGFAGAIMYIHSPRKHEDAEFWSNDIILWAQPFGLKPYFPFYDKRLQREDHYNQKEG